MNNYLDNPLMDTDSYKWSHSKQYPPGMTKMFSYISPRGGAYKEVLFFGLQAILKGIRPFTWNDLDIADIISRAHGVPLPVKALEKCILNHNGYLPMKIRAIKEGSRIPVGLPVMTIESTDPELFFVPGLLETQLMRIWYPSTVATTSWEVKKIIRKYLEETADDLSGLPFKLHDFGSRGVSSKESAMLGGMAHLVNFMGTDTTIALAGAIDLYNAPGPVGYSIPAAEHSTITSWGRENEVKAFGNMLDQFAKPGSILAVVSDSYDIYNAINQLWGTELKQRVIDSGATLVVRPDSGDPLTVSLKCIELLNDKFGSDTNSKGYRVLKNVRVIYGDGIDPKMIQDILSNLKAYGYSADNIAFGMGGALLQKCNRDTMAWAMKCSSATINGIKEDVYKDPVEGNKASLKGEISTFRFDDGRVETARLGIDLLTDADDLLEDVWIDGELVREQSFAEIRSLAA